MGLNPAGPRPAPCQGGGRGFGSRHPLFVGVLRTSPSGGVLSLSWCMMLVVATGFATGRSWRASRSTPEVGATPTEWCGAFQMGGSARSRASPTRTPRRTRGSWVNSTAVGEHLTSTRILPVFAERPLSDLARLDIQQRAVSAPAVSGIVAATAPCPDGGQRRRRYHLTCWRAAWPRWLRGP